MAKFIQGMSVVCSPFDFSVLSLKDFFPFITHAAKEHHPQRKIFSHLSRRKALQALLSNTTQYPERITSTMDYAHLLQVAKTSTNPRGEMRKIEDAIEEELNKILSFMAERYVTYLNTIYASYSTQNGFKETRA